MEIGKLKDVIYELVNVAEYEFTPTYFKNIDNACVEICEKLDKLADYEDKQEQGLLKILPCPVGTVVHEPYKFCGNGAWEIDHHYLKLEDLDKIGVTVFIDENDAKAYITEREAEEAQAKMGGK